VSKAFTKSRQRGRRFLEAVCWRLKWRALFRVIFWASWQPFQTLSVGPQELRRPQEAQGVSVRVVLSTTLGLENSSLSRSLASPQVQSG
jgi:hypothetical protein